MRPAEGQQRVAQPHLGNEDDLFIRRADLQVAGFDEVHAVSQLALKEGGRTTRGQGEG